MLETKAYRLRLDARNGAIVGLADRRAGVELLGGVVGCLWGVVPADGSPPTGGCLFRPRAANAFSYRWSGGVLELRYRRASGGVEATATVRPGAEALDLRLTVENGSQSRLERVRFPIELAARSADVRAGYGPHALPGVRLAPAFFSRVRTTTFPYPSRWAFADWLALDLAGGHLALSAVNPPPAPIAPVDIGWSHGETGPCGGPRFCIVHGFRTWIAPGATWTSPTLRLRVGATVEGALAAYRTENGIDAYPSLEAKAGARLPALEQAPLVKADLWHGLHPFRDWGPDLRRLPSPALLHPVAFQPRGHDESFPDFLPTDPIWGSTDEFRAALEDARGLGILSMPYLNISWWDDESPTLRALPAGTSISDVAALDESGRPRLETYSRRSGYAVSPWSPFVRDRVGRLLEQFRTEVPVDCLFFDQIGARPWLRDLNASEPTPESYEDGWLSLLAPYADRCLMMEDGWDRLASISTGFASSLLLLERQDGLPDEYFGAGNWQPFPISLRLFHDKVLTYQHDLYEGTMTADPEVLAFDLAYGYLMSLAWDGSTNSLASPWLRVPGDFQRALGPLYAGQPLVDWREPAPDVTETRFPSLTVVANWGRAPIERDGYGLGRFGVLARSADGAVVAGAFTGTFAGAPLSPGAHYLVVQRDGGGVTVRQPLGADTDVTVPAPAAAVRVHGIDAQGRLIGESAASVSGGRVAFRYAATAAGQPVVGYRVVPA